MIVSTVIPTDLITPLGAYIRLRESGQSSFLLESVERALGQEGASPFANAMKLAAGAADELAAEIESSYKRALI